MPAEGLPAIPRERLLSADELVRLVGIAVHRLGVCEVRFTGGEPLMRRDLEDIIEGCARVAPHVPLAITSNAVGLEHRAQGLARAGLTRINIPSTPSIARTSPRSRGVTASTRSSRASVPPSGTSGG